jgi:hypothetical protein
LLVYAQIESLPGERQVGLPHRRLLGFSVSPRREDEANVEVGRRPRLATGLGSKQHNGQDCAIILSALQ